MEGIPGLYPVGWHSLKRTPLLTWQTIHFWICPLSARAFRESDEDTLSQSYDEEQERSRKLAAEHMHVSERKVREVQGIFA